MSGAVDIVLMWSSLPHLPRSSAKSVASFFLLAAPCYELVLFFLWCAPAFRWLVDIPIISLSLAWIWVFSRPSSTTRCDINAPLSHDLYLVLLPAATDYLPALLPFSLRGSLSLTPSWHRQVSSSGTRPLVAGCEHSYCVPVSMSYDRSNRIYGISTPPFLS
ncbi:hypothetical protein K438DRAFT_1980225 [Mycena galopus ATCC 62051]|nr:hypothetical protein K438DRAFT_1980225 [Mycena galopus ATCC 62051]